MDRKFMRQYKILLPDTTVGAISPATLARVPGAGSGGGFSVKPAGDPALQPGASTSTHTAARAEMLVESPVSNIYAISCDPFKFCVLDTPPPCDEPIRADDWVSTVKNYLHSNTFICTMKMLKAVLNARIGASPTPFLLLSSTAATVVQRMLETALQACSETVNLFVRVRNSQAQQPARVQHGAADAAVPHPLTEPSLLVLQAISISFELTETVRAILNDYRRQFGTAVIPGNALSNIASMLYYTVEQRFAAASLQMYEAASMAYAHLSSTFPSEDHTSYCTAIFRMTGIERPVCAGREGKISVDPAIAQSIDFLKPFSRLYGSMADIVERRTRNDICGMLNNLSLVYYIYQNTKRAMVCAEAVDFFTERVMGSVVTIPGLFRGIADFYVRGTLSTALVALFLDKFSDPTETRLLLQEPLFEQLDAQGRCNRLVSLRNMLLASLCADYVTGIFNPASPAKRASRVTEDIAGKLHHVFYQRVSPATPPAIEKSHSHPDSPVSCDSTSSTTAAGLYELANAVEEELHGSAPARKNRKRKSMDPALEVGDDNDLATADSDGSFVVGSVATRAKRRRLNSSVELDIVETEKLTKRQSLLR